MIIHQTNAGMVYITVHRVAENPEVQRKTLYVELFHVAFVT